MILRLYRWLSPFLAALAGLAAPFAPKLAATRRWRLESDPIAGARELPAAGRRLWIHAASAGELEQARPLLKALRRTEPETVLVLSLASVSARRAAAGVDEANLIFPLPADSPKAMGALLDAVVPEALLLVKWDVWPNLVMEAGRRRIPVLLMGAVLSDRSRRARWPGRLLAAPLHRRLDAVGAASEADARQFRRQGVGPERLSVTGDTRFDRVIERRDEGREPPLHAGPSRAGCLVAGSTWPREEDWLLEHFAILRREKPGIRLILVPHEPSDDHLDRIDEAARGLGLPLSRLSAEAELPPGAICLVDRLGILPELYGLGDLAFVGGGFGRGVHSVLEPAVHGLPVMMGPEVGRADEARRLAEMGGAFILRRPGVILTRWRHFLDQPEALAAASGQAQAFVRSHAGATDRSLELLKSVLAGSPDPNAA